MTAQAQQREEASAAAAGIHARARHLKAHIDLDGREELQEPLRQWFDRHNAHDLIEEVECILDELETIREWIGSHNATDEPHEQVVDHT
jgi:uncharacterized protein Yka (UPF0111/DUF47 family)